MSTIPNSAAQFGAVVANAPAPSWYAAYVCVRHEKKIAEQLRLREVEHFLPLYTARNRWNQRYVDVQLPLFPGYVFVHIPLMERLRVLSVPSVVHLVGTNGRPQAVSDTEIDALRNSLALRRAEPYPYLAAGKRVKVQAGPLEGLQGVIVRCKGQWRMVVSVDSIARSVMLELDAADLAVLSS